MLIAFIELNGDGLYDSRGRMSRYANSSSSARCSAEASTNVTAVPSAKWEDFGAARAPSRAITPNRRDRTPST